MFYLITKDQAYALFPDRTYQLGYELDISLPLAVPMTLDVLEDSCQLGNTTYRTGVHILDLGTEVQVVLLVLPEVASVYLPEEVLYLSSEDYAMVRISIPKLEVVLRAQSDGWHLVSNQIFYHNGETRSSETLIKSYDQVVFVSGLYLSVIDNRLIFSAVGGYETSLISAPKTEQDDRGRDFHRSPRIILREPDTKITIASAPTEVEETRQPLLKLLITPLAMLVFTGLSYYFFRSGGMVLMMMGMSLITIGTSLHSYFSDKKKHRTTQAKKLADYLTYLDGKYEELSSSKDDQAAALLYHYPATKDLLEMAKNLDRRIYEKTPYHFDFLTYRLGLGQVKASFAVDYAQTEMTKYSEVAHQKVGELLDYYRKLDNMPLQNKLGSPIGYIGSRRVVIEQVQQLMMQIALFQSYHDVQFVPIFREEELGLWHWSRWLPHVQLKVFNSRGFIYSQRTRDQLLTSLYQIIKERKLDSEQDKTKEKQYSPRYVLLITDLSLLLDHNIMEYINEDLSHLGIHYVFVEEVIESLPEHVKTVVDYRGDKKATLILQEGHYLNQAFSPLPAIDLEAKETFARNMAGITHVQTLRNAIPESITFLEMYGVDRVEDLDMLRRWKENDTYQTMSVPLGVRGRDDILYLNLHEKAHGPHGLIAGTTGSGKSELIQSYIASLAVNYHPYEVAFLLIDYKGGGMANLFADLPHVVGTITNLDGNQANRALVSIKAELQKRQRLFQDNNVNHINQYTKLFKEGKVQEPLPHLLIISDEFAELNANQPDFMDELVSTARIGRSLGVKLILATQKPSGVVNDQIWSNSKFKIALKVQDVADSREVIKTPDAAEITQTGRAYLQVGNNEIYELFQSAWSGAAYNPDGKAGVQRETTLYAITDSGQYQAINKDLSGLSKKKDVKSLPTELDAIVDQAHKLFEGLHLPKVASPWLPPLETQIFSKDLQETDFKTYWGENQDLRPLLIGYQDIPEKQEQSPLYLDMEEAGHILLVSSPGFGKSTFLQTLAVDAMRKHTPKEVHFYLYDFGTSGLIALSEFPHVADYFTLDETEKILKSLRRLHQMVKERKTALSKLKATNLRQYNQLSETSFPTLFVLIDGFDGVAESPFADAFYEVLNIIARDGASLGIYLVSTLSRLNAMRLQLQSNFKTKIALYLFDPSDLSGVVGRSNIPQDEIKGRAIIKRDAIIQFQVALPYASHAYTDYISEVAREVSAMTAAYDGTLPSGVPMLPEKVTLDKIDLTAHDFVFGLDREWVKPAGFSLSKPLLMASDSSVFVTNYYKILDYQFKRLQNSYKLVILDNQERVPSQLFDGGNRFTTNSEVGDVLRTIIADLKERLTAPDKAYKQWLVLIPDLAATAVSAGLSEADMKLLLIEGAKHGVTPLFMGSYQDLVNNSYDNAVKLMLQLVDQVFLGVRISDQNHTRYPYINNEPSLKANQGYILHPDSYEMVQLLEF